MATIVRQSWNYLSDLLARDIDPADGRSRRMVNITAAEGTSIPMGTLVYKVKDLDQTAPYEIVTTPATQIVAGNTLAVVFGDGVGERIEFKANASGTTPAVAFVQGEVILKDRLVLEVNNITRGSAVHKTLKALLEDQNIYLGETMTQFTR